MNTQQIKGLLTGNPGKLPNPENAEVVRRAAAEGIVLLKNDGTLPLRPGRVALFGAGAEGTVYCGTGSGYVFTAHAVTVAEGLRNAGFVFTSRNWLKRCAEHEKKVNREDKTLSMLDRRWSGISILAEEPEITQEDLEQAKCRVCIYVLRRNAGEGGDRRAEKGDYYLSDRERENLTRVAAFFDYTVVVMNTCVMDLNFADEIPGIRAVLYMGLGGMESGNALADVLTGKVNPCGKLTDTLARQYSDYPAAGHFADQDGSQLHPVYREGIYVGYRYFDSFGIAPLYPFGFGLSYSRFVLETLEAAADWGKTTIRVRVTNTGRYAGRQVVQLYASAPAGTLDKPWQELKAYAKTGVLEPGSSEDVELSFATEQLASFSQARSAWIMEPGCYFLRIGDSSRNTTVAATIVLDDEAVTRQVTACLEEDQPLEELHAAPAAAAAPEGIVLQLSAAACGTVDNVSRMARTVTTLVPEGTAYTGLVNDSPCHGPNFCEEILETVPACFGSTLYDVQSGLVPMEAFVASLPDEVLVRICTGTLEETPWPVPARTSRKLKNVSYPASSGATTAQYAQSLGIPTALLFDGPGGAHIMGCAATALPVGMVLAQTWDPELQQEVGIALAKDMAYYHITVILAPGMNIHRDPLGGRAFEYYSEDPLISGLTAAALTSGVQQDGKHGVAIKHFAANNQETDRLDGMNTISPRALREVYLKGFELCVRRAKPMTVMTSYNGINGVHTSSRRDLVTDLLRSEWGFRGFVMTDWGTHSDKVLDLQAGNDIIMGGYRAEKLLEAMRPTAPEFTPDGAVKETVLSSNFGFVKSTLTSWGSFAPGDGPDTVTATVAAGTPVNPRVKEAEKAGYARVYWNPDGTRTVVYTGTELGARLARGTLQACAARILEVLVHSAAMDDLMAR